MLIAFSIVGSLVFLVILAFWQGEVDALRAQREYAEVRKP